MSMTKRRRLDLSSWREVMRRFGVVDMRRSYDGLYAIARAAFALDPTGGDLYVFVNRRGSQMKVLYFDRSGWCVWAKRLQAGRFIADWTRVATREIDCTQPEDAHRRHRATALRQALSTPGRCGNAHPLPWRHTAHRP